MKKTYSLVLPYKKIAPVLLVCTCILVLASVFCSYYYNYLGVNSVYAAFFTKLFDLNTEGNIPTLFSTLLLLGAALLLGLKHIKAATYGDSNKRYWLFLSLVFVFLALDESLQIHEKVTNIINLIGKSGGVTMITERPPYLRYAWVLPYMVILVFLTIFLYRFVFQLDTKTRFLFILGGSIFVFGAIGLELFEAYFDATLGKNFYTVILYTIEEACEMIGVIIFLHALLALLAESKETVEVDFVTHFKEDIKHVRGDHVV